MLSFVVFNRNTFIIRYHELSFTVCLRRKFSLLDLHRIISLKLAKRIIFFLLGSLILFKLSLQSSNFLEIL